MRSEQEMLDLILSTARADERIRAVMLNGSRANPNAPHDFFQDFDIVYFVTDVESLKQEPHWIDRFGERMILQLPDDMGDPPPVPGDHYAYLIQFTDGNRIDLTLYPVDKLDQREKDSQTVILLDKDGLFGEVPPPGDQDYLPKPPTARQFFDCCNEFWWVCPYAAKGLWRGEITYARQMADEYVREQLMKMLFWWVGVKFDFKVSPGKMGKYLERCLPADWWALLLSTYSDATVDKSWDALIAMGTLFRSAALEVADHYGFKYLQVEDERVSAHLQHVRSLPRNARQMY